MSLIRWDPVSLEVFCNWSLKAMDKLSQNLVQECTVAGEKKIHRELNKYIVINLFEIDEGHVVKEYQM